jgi:hypothetical protein
MGKGKGGGGAPPPSSQTVTQTNLPEYARPYFENLMQRAQAESYREYQPYEGERIAGFDPMQQQAFERVGEQGVAPQIGQASGLAGEVGQAALGTQPTAAGLQQQALQYGGLGSQYGALGAMTSPQAQRYGAAAVGIGALGADAAQQGFGAGAQYAQQATSPESMQAYMSPYMQNVVDRQQQEAIRQSNIARQSEQARAVGQGAFGGSRSAIVEAEMQRDLGNRMADIQAQGLQSAFQQAQQAQQFGAGLGLQGLQTGFQGLQTGIAGQEAGMRGIQTGLQGTAQGIQGAQTGLQGVGQATGAGQYGLAGLGTAGQAASTLGQLGQTQFGQETGITEAMARAGEQQRTFEQQRLDTDYADFLRQRDYPTEQLAYFSNMLRGLPVQPGSMQTTYAPPPSTLSQVGGLGLAGLGLYNMMQPR